MASKASTKKPAKRAALKTGHSGSGSEAKAKKVSALTVRVAGPGIGKGRLAIPDLIKVCEEAQNAVTRQAEALEGRKSIHPGPAAANIRKECTLELIGIGNGSAELYFDFATPQMVLPMEQKTLGKEAIVELVGTIQSLGNGNKKRDLDPGVLRGIFGIGELLDKRLTSVTFSSASLPGKKKATEGKITNKVKERAAAHLSKPRYKRMQIDGVLDMADFSRKERKCRIDPAIGSAVACTFDVDLEDKVHSLLRQPVRATGIGKILPDSQRLESFVIDGIAPIESLDLGEGNFFASPSIDVLMEQQGIKPFSKKSLVEWDLSDEEMEAFVSDVYAARDGV